MRKRAKRDSGSVAPSRTAAIGGTRVARSAGRRLASSVTRMPTSSETTIVRVSKTRPLFGSVKPTASKSLKSPFASPSPRKRPVTDASDADDERLDHDRASTWRRDAPSVRSGRELARPLRDRDRERVRDHEAADEERDAAEREQEVPQERDELVRVRRVLRRLLDAADDLRVRRQDRLDLADQLLGR